jgi:tetratricopeptide (TPR) repeat protein
VLGALAVLGRYVALTLWPASLSVDYSFDALGIGPGFRANSDSVVAIGFLALAVLALRKSPGRRDVVQIGLLLAAASYSIVSNTIFVLGTILGERLFYLPSAGLCLAAAAIAQPLFAPNKAGRGRVLAAGAVAVAVAVAAITIDRDRSREWLTPVALFEAATRAVPRSARAQMELASAYGNAGRVDDAARHFAVALEIKPDYSSAAYNQGNTLARAARYEEAAAAYRQAIAIDPRFTRAWHNLALTERIRGRTDAWLEALGKAAESSPASAALQNEYAEALLTTEHYGEAVSAYDRVIASGAAVAATYFNRGVAHHHLGGCRVAVEDYRQAAAAPAPPGEAFTAAAGCLRELGRNEEAAAIEEAAKVANRGTRR